MTKVTLALRNYLINFLFNSGPFKKNEIWDAYQLHIWGENLIDVQISALHVEHLWSQGLDDGATCLRRGIDVLHRSSVTEDTVFF